MSYSGFPIDAGALPDPIQWHEGMLLAPQHFQQLSHRHDALLHYRTATLAPFHWGVRQLRVDPVLLVNGRFRVLELEGMMPDGLVVRRAPEDMLDLEVDLLPFAAEMDGRPMTVHLAVPAHRVGASAAGSELARYYSIETGPFIDENTGEGDLQIPRLRPKMTLLVGDAPPSRYITMPLARVIYRNEMFSLADYVHPTLTVAQISPIGEICAQVAKRLREKALFLSEEVRTHYYDMGVEAVVETKLMIRSLVDALPTIEALLYTGLAHPFSLYMALCAVAGRVAALGSSMVPPVFEPYDHNDPRASFERVQVYVMRMLEEGIWESYFVIPFHLQDGLFTLRFDEAWSGRPCLIGVRSAAGATERETVTWIEESLIGTQSKIPSLRERRILGVDRRRVEREDAFAAARGLLLFAIDQEPEFMTPGEFLQVVNQAERGDTVAPAEMLLFVHKERREKV